MFERDADHPFRPIAHRRPILSRKPNVADSSTNAKPQDDMKVVANDTGRRNLLILKKRSNFAGIRSRRNRQFCRWATACPLYGLDNVQAGELVEFPNAFGHGLTSKSTMSARQIRFGPLHQRSDTVSARASRSSGGQRASGRVSILVQSYRWQGRSGEGAPAPMSRRRIIREICACTHVNGLRRSLLHSDRARPRVTDHGDRQTADRDHSRYDPHQSLIRGRRRSFYCVYVACGQKRSTVAQFVKIRETMARLNIRSASRQRLGTAPLNICTLRRMHEGILPLNTAARAHRYDYLSNRRGLPPMSSAAPAAPDSVSWRCFLSHSRCWSVLQAERSEQGRSLTALP